MKRNASDQDNGPNPLAVPKEIYEMNVYIGVLVLIVQLVLDLNEPAARLMFSYVVVTMVSIATSLKFFRIDSLLLGLVGFFLTINFGFGLIYSTWTYNNLDETLRCFLICSDF